MTEPLYWRDMVERQNAGRPLSKRWIDWFGRHGVPATVLAFSPAGEVDMLLRDCVEWCGDGLFDFADGDPNVLTFLARDRYGYVQDVIVWCPKTDTLAAWTGRACMIGADQLDAMQPDDAGLMVCETVLQWLQARRMGIVILDLRRALPMLLERPLLTTGLDHGRSLRGALTRALPPVLIPETAIGEMA
jgi:hypothetical protein